WSHGQLGLQPIGPLLREADCEYPATHSCLVERSLALGIWPLRLLVDDELERAPGTVLSVIPNTLVSSYQAAKHLAPDGLELSSVFHRVVEQVETGNRARHRGRFPNVGAGRVHACIFQNRVSSENRGHW